MGRIDQLNKKGLIDIGNVSLWVEEQGKGIPLLLISGGPGTSHHYFHPHFNKAASFSKVIYVDLRGVGKSQYTPTISYTIQQSVDDLEKLRLKLGIKKWFVMGLSFGGSIAQVYTLKYPESVHGLILVSSTVSRPINVGQGSRQYYFFSIQERKRVEEIYTINGKRVIPVHSDSIPQDIQRRMLFNAFVNGDWKRRHMYKWSTQDIAHYASYEFVHDKNYYSEMINDEKKYDLTGVFEKCPIPTLIIEGKWDMAFGENKAQLFASSFPNAEVRLMEKAGHVPYEDEPEQFFSYLKSFIQTATKLKPHAEWKKSIENLTIYPTNKR